MSPLFFRPRALLSDLPQRNVANFSVEISVYPGVYEVSATGGGGGGGGGDSLYGWYGYGGQRGSYVSATRTLAGSVTGRPGAQGLGGQTNPGGGGQKGGDGEECRIDTVYASGGPGGDGAPGFGGSFHSQWQGQAGFPEPTNGRGGDGGRGTPGSNGSSGSYSIRLVG